MLYMPWILSSSVLQFWIPVCIQSFFAFEPKIVQFSIKLKITYISTSFVFHDLWQLWLEAYDASIKFIYSEMALLRVRTTKE